MKRLFLLTPLLIVMLISCNDFIVPYSEYTFEEYNGSLEAARITEAASWSPRWDHAAAVFNGYLWIFGGYDTTARGEEDSYREDVWRSSDGEYWEQVTANAPWKGRRGHAVSVLNNALYLTGGFSVDQKTGIRSYCNDVWKSNDGEHWECIVEDAPWGVRMNHALITANDGSQDTLYLFGGFFNGLYFRSDMWKSADGVNWIEIELPEGDGTGGAFPGARASFASCLGDNGKIYMQGGSYYGAPSHSTGTVDEESVSFLNNPANWSSIWYFDPTEESAGWRYDRWGMLPAVRGNRRAEQVLVPFNGELWMFAGKSNSGWSYCESHETYSTLSYRGYTSENPMDPEISWNVDSYGAPMDPRYGYTANIFKEKIYILGGFSTNGPTHDVWCIEGGE